jgi:hypothetical protein
MMIKACISEQHNFKCSVDNYIVKGKYSKHSRELQKWNSRILIQMDLRNIKTVKKMICQ